MKISEVIKLLSHYLHETNNDVELVIEIVDNYNDMNLFSINDIMFEGHDGDAHIIMEGSVREI